MCSSAAVIAGCVLSCIARLAIRSRSQGWAQPPSTAASEQIARTTRPGLSVEIPAPSVFIQQPHDVVLVDGFLRLVETVVGEADAAGLVDHDRRRQIGRAH